MCFTAAVFLADVPNFARCTYRTRSDSEACVRLTWMRWEGTVTMQVQSDERSRARRPYRKLVRLEAWVGFSSQQISSAQRGEPRECRPILRMFLDFCLEEAHQSPCAAELWCSLQVSLRLLFLVNTFLVSSAAHLSRFLQKYDGKTLSICSCISAATSHIKQ